MVKRWRRDKDLDIDYDPGEEAGANDELHISWPRRKWITFRYNLRTPHVPLRGIRPDVDALYDGEMVAAVAAWWTGFLRARPALHLRDRDGKGWFFRTIDHMVPEITHDIPKENRDLLRAVARSRSVHGRLSEACFALAYCFARTFMIAGGNPSTPGAVITPEQIEKDAIRYSIVADYYMLQESAGFWADNELDSVVWRWAIQAFRWSYADQVKRWEKAEGVTMGQGIGFGDLEAGLVQRFSDVLFEHGGRFLGVEWMPAYDEDDIPEGAVLVEDDGPA